MNLFYREDLVRAIEAINRIMIQNRDYLIELDSEIGDGDLGITMTKGFAAAVEAARTSPEHDVGKMFIQIGFAISKAAPSTMGTLMATAFIGAGKAVQNRESIDASALAYCIRRMAETVSERGKAQEGDKTMLDVLFPVARAMETYSGSDISELMKIAASTADEALESTKRLINQHGKAAVFRERSLGCIDPGAAATKLVIQGIAEACQGR